MGATLTISWTRPTNCTLCTFEYGYKLHSDTTYITGATLSGTSQIITGLVNGASYDVRLRTVAPDTDGVTGPIRSRWITSSVVTCDFFPPEIAETPLPTPTPQPTATPQPTPTLSCSFDGTVVYGLPITPTPTLSLSGFYYTSVFGTYPVTSPGNAQLRIYNYTSDPKYIYLYGNSTYMTSGTLAGYATMDPGGANETTTSMSVTITGMNQISYGTNQSYLYIPAMTYYNFNIVHTSPSAGSFLFQYTDSTHPTKVNVPLQS